MDYILSVKNLQKKFGSLTAVGDLSFDVRRGEILGLLGPNGAGKTTIFNLLSGAYKADQGQILLDGEDIAQKSPARRCHLGIGRTYQIPKPFAKLSVYENLLVCAVHGAKMSEKEARPWVHEVLELVRLEQRKADIAGSIPLLDRKRLELAKALATKPKLILIDEVAGGLTEGEAEQLLEIVKQIQRSGVTIIWIEHVLMMMGKGGVDRLLCVADGARSLMCGVPEVVMNSEEVQACYIGVEEA
ncbi:MAG: ABC transporter ATP-binding protein [Spirochaetales bacterium]|jgi:branched-chain amino acid transport system ATP-binding protein|nr:ABC transporter ATP-binding protein [Spirochaetales bacterium]